MTTQPFDLTGLSVETPEVPPEELQLLAGCLAEAHRRAQAGTPVVGYTLLCESRESVRESTRQAEWGPELLRRWDEALNYYVSCTARCHPQP